MTASAIERANARFGLTVISILLGVGVFIWVVVTGLDADAKVEEARGHAAAAEFHRNQTAPPPAGHVPVAEPAPESDPRLPLVR